MASIRDKIKIIVIDIVDYAKLIMYVTIPLHLFLQVLGTTDKICIQKEKTERKGETCNYESFLYSIPHTNPWAALPLPLKDLKGINVRRTRTVCYRRFSMSST